MSAESEEQVTEEQITEEQEQMWKRLLEPRQPKMEAGYFYAPYIPIGIVNTNVS